jgi:polyphosphate kinase
MSALIDSLSAAYRCGALSPDLFIRGLCCLQNLYEEEEDAFCQCCHHAVQSRPIKSVVRFECEGSSAHQIASLRSNDLDVCIDRHDMVRL